MTSPVHVGRAFGSLRNSDFNTVSAIGEVIDNSIEAEAKNIRIRIKKEEIRKNKVDLIEIAFADDGKGMTVETLGKCLQLGFSERYNNRGGIGRFGVGMTLGAVTQCTRIEVYSKPQGGGWNFTYLDLDEMADQEDPIIPPPKPTEIPREYADMMSERGTLVVWKNWDREDATIEEMIVWIGRTYRKFIGSKIIEGQKIIDNPNQRHIILDDGSEEKEISSFDPLYVTKTDYNAETTDLEAPIVLEEHVHEFDKPPNPPDEPNKIVIRTSLLPESWRLERGTGNSTDNKKRLVPANEGVSILRNNREVFYGPLPYYRIRDEASSHYKGFIDLDRFWGCEISFDANLDHWFSIKNIKVGARPIKDLREKIENHLNATIHDFRKEIRGTWAKTSVTKLKKTKGSIDDRGKAENIVKDNTPEPPPSNKGDINHILKDAGIKKDETKRELEEKLSNNPVTFHMSYEMDERGNFIDMTRRGARTLLNINMRHPFFRKFNELIDDLKEHPDEHKKDGFESFSNNINDNLKLLLASLALARKDINSEESQPAGDVLDKLMRNWAYYLERVVKPTLEDQ